MMENVLRDALNDVIGVVLVGVGSALAVLINILVSRVKEKYGIEDIVDRHVQAVEEDVMLPNAGAAKKKRVKSAVKEELKRAGISIAKRALVTVFGRIGRSIDRSVKRNINDKITVGRHP